MHSVSSYKARLNFLRPTSCWGPLLYIGTSPTDKGTSLTDIVTSSADIGTFAADIGTSPADICTSPLDPRTSPLDLGISPPNIVTKDKKKLTKICRTIITKTGEVMSTLHPALQWGELDITSSETDYHDGWSRLAILWVLFKFSFFYGNVWIIHHPSN